MKKRVLNPFLLTDPALRRAFKWGVRAARHPAGQKTEYNCETDAEYLAWLKGFTAARVTDAGVPYS